MPQLNGSVFGMTAMVVLKFTSCAQRLHCLGLAKVPDKKASLCSLAEIETKPHIEQ